ncbi:hypothetical protein R3P38DRAFT_2800283 [Favolaschia claudopus]|uniref:Uncharacterized protein n=1 Tax=Favolaschia claudopus TaxID=2862362 RepID=A0AAV9ZYF4_9AGAR
MIQGGAAPDARALNRNYQLRFGRRQANPALNASSSGFCTSLLLPSPSPRRCAARMDFEPPAGYPRPQRGKLRLIPPSRKLFAGAVSAAAPRSGANTFDYTYRVLANDANTRPDVSSSGIPSYLSRLLLSLSPRSGAIASTRPIVVRRAGIFNVLTQAVSMSRTSRRIDVPRAWLSPGRKSKFEILMSADQRFQRCTRIFFSRCAGYFIVISATIPFGKLEIPRSCERASGLSGVQCQISFVSAARRITANNIIN